MINRVRVRISQFVTILFKGNVAQQNWMQCMGNLKLVGF